MKIEQLSSNCYRVRKQIDGKSESLYFDHIPNDLEIAEEVINKFGKRSKTSSKAFIVYAKEYIAIKDSVLSPSTIRSYDTIVRSLSDQFGKKDINAITQADIQSEINDYARKHSPKSVRNYHGFISAVLKMYRPNLQIYTTLPQKRKYEAICPTEDDVKTLLKEIKGTEYSIPYQLGILGLRRSEICALTHADLKGNKLTINKGKVQDRNNKWTNKPYPKTDASNRVILIPDALVKEIKASDVIYSGSPHVLNNHLHDLQDKLQLPRFRFHDLRHYFASYCHALGIADAYIMEMGGWSSEYTMKRVYREAMRDKVDNIQKIITDNLLTS